MQVMTLPILCDELIMEILSWLPVKSLVRFMCVCRSFQSLISDPNFVKLHLQRSSKKVDFLLMYWNDILESFFILPCPVRSVLDNSLSLVTDDVAFKLEDMYEVVGTCNGLVCLIGELNNYQACVFRVWNPATRKIFKDMQCVLDLPRSDNLVGISAFGYDNLSDTYKVVSIVSRFDFNDGSVKSCDVKVCTISQDSCWKNIQTFPADPTSICSIEGRGVYLNGTLNWLALPLSNDHYRYRDDDFDAVTLDQWVIVSLNLGNETYSQLLLPRGLCGIYKHNLCHIFGVLNDCLSLFLHNHETKHYSVWQMKEFGDEKSWTLSLNIAIQDLQVNYTPSLDLVPLIMFQNGGALMIGFDSTRQGFRAIIYNGRDNILLHSKISCNVLWIYPMDYVQSLVSL